MADYWIKLYHEIIDDPKMATLPDRLWRRTIELFLLAGRLCPDKSGLLPDTRKIAWALRIPTDECQADLEQLAISGIIVAKTNGWLIVNFAKRQGAIPGSERSKAHRERQQKQQYYDNVTNAKRFVTQSTESEQSQIKESEQSTPPAPQQPPSEDKDKFDQIQAWLSKNTGLPATGKDDVDTITELAKLEIIEADIKDAIGWLNGTAGKTARRYSSLLNPIKTSYAKRIQTANGNGNGGRKLDAFEAPPIPEERIRYVDGKKEVLEKRYKTWAEYDAHLAKWRAELAEGDRIREAELKAEAEARNERM